MNPGPTLPRARYVRSVLLLSARALVSSNPPVAFARAGTHQTGQCRSQLHNKPGAEPPTSPKLASTTRSRVASAGISRPPSPSRPAPTVENHTQACHPSLAHRPLARGCSQSPCPTHSASTHSASLPTPPLSLKRSHTHTHTQGLELCRGRRHRKPCAPAYFSGGIHTLLPTET